MIQVATYPQVCEDKDNQEFLAAWRDEGKLLLQQASHGGRPFFYPRPICPYTGSMDLKTIVAIGRGTVVSYSLVMRPNDPAFNCDVPIILAEIMLEEKVAMLGRIVGDAARVRSGCTVELVPPDEAGKYAMPVFYLSSAGPF